MTNGKKLTENEETTLDSLDVTDDIEELEPKIAPVSSDALLDL